MSIGGNIRYLRKKSGLTQKELAQAVGVNEVTIRSYEGKKYIPKTEVLYKLCQVLECNIREILGEPLDLASSEIEAIGHNIKKIRTKQGLSESDLAKLTKLSESSIKSYENGEKKPSLDTLHTIADALGVYIGNIVVDWSIYPEHKDFDPFSFAVSSDSFIAGVARQVEHEERTLLEYYRLLNSGGQAEAIKRIQELTEIKKYTEQEE